MSRTCNVSLAGSAARGQVPWHTLSAMYLSPMAAAVGIERPSIVSRTFHQGSSSGIIFFCSYVLIIKNFPLGSLAVLVVEHDGLLFDALVACK